MHELPLAVECCRRSRLFVADEDEVELLETACEDPVDVASAACVCRMLMLNDETVFFMRDNVLLDEEV